MKPKRLILIFCSAVAAVTLLWLVVAGRGIRPVSSQRASVTFLGFTNVPANGRCAIFSLTNASSVLNGFLVDSFEESISGVWARRGLTNGTGLTSQAHAWLSGFLGWQDSLEPGKTAVFCVPRPVSNGSWRVCFICQEREPKDAWRSFWGTGTPSSAVFVAKP